MSRRLADVAQRAGVSEATVSRVLNDRPGVSGATRAAVMTALDVLGYERPGSLRGERPRMIGIVLPEMHNPVFPAFAQAVGGALARLGFATVLCACDVTGPSEADYVRMLLGQQVSGVVFTGGQFAEADSPHEHYERLAEARLPAVLVNSGLAERPARLQRSPAVGHWRAGVHPPFRFC